MTPHAAAIARQKLTPADLAQQEGMSIATILKWIKVGRKHPITRELIKPARVYHYNKRVIRVDQADWDAFNERFRI